MILELRGPHEAARGHHADSVERQRRGPSRCLIVRIGLLIALADKGFDKEVKMTSSPNTEPNEVRLSEFASLWASKAGEIHRRLMKEFAKLSSQTPEAHLARLVELGVISATDSEHLARMMGILQSTAGTFDIAQLDRLRDTIKTISAPSLVAVAIAGVISDSAKAHNTPLAFSVAGADAIGAVLGGVGGAVAGSMVGGEFGAYVGGALGAVLIGGKASQEAAQEHPV